MKQLIALAVIAAATLAADQAELQPGTTFEAPDDVADKLVADGLVPGGGSPAEFAKVQADDIAASGKLIADKKVTLD